MKVECNVVNVEHSEKDELIFYIHDKEVFKLDVSDVEDIMIKNFLDMNKKYLRKDK